MILRNALTLGAAATIAASLAGAQDFTIVQSASADSTSDTARGQTFTPNIGEAPEIGNLSTVVLTSFTLTVGANGNGFTPDDTVVRLAILDGPNLGSGNIAGFSDNTVDLSTLTDGNDITFTFTPGLELDAQGVEYGAVVIVEDINLDPTLFPDGIRPTGQSFRGANAGDPYAGGGAINSGMTPPLDIVETPLGVDADADLAFTAEFTIPAQSLQIRQTRRNGFSGSGTRGQSFTPVVGLSPFAIIGDTIEITSMEFLATGSGSSGDTTVLLGIFDGRDIDASNLLALSTNTVDFTTLVNRDDPARWDFANDALPAFEELFAQFVVVDATAPSGYRTAGLAVLRQATPNPPLVGEEGNPYPGGGLLFSGNGAPDDDNDARFEIDFAAPALTVSADLDSDGDVDGVDTQTFLDEFEAATQ
ncbi:MAG: hypothetical protein AAGI30_01735 [Planctomycetota bacterium]